MSKLKRNYANSKNKNISDADREKRIFEKLLL